MVDENDLISNRSVFYLFNLMRFRARVDHGRSRQAEPMLFTELIHVPATKSRLRLSHDRGPPHLLDGVERPLWGQPV